MALLAVAFSTIKGWAIAVAAVNAAVLAAALVCKFFLYRSAKKEKNDQARPSSTRSSK